MNDWTIECVDSDGETDTFLARLKNEPLIFCQINSSGSIEFRTERMIHINEYEVVRGWIYKEVRSMWEQMNIASDR